jgi:CRP-like cAMP-binding protein
MQRLCVTGEIIFREGDTSDVAYVIVKGKVEIFRSFPSVPQYQLAVLEAGQMFGEMGVMDHAPRSASARALMDTVLRAVVIEEE